MKKLWTTVYRKVFAQNEVININSDRVQNALNVKKNAVNDFFGGWEESDLTILDRYKFSEPLDYHNGEIIDWLGIKTDANLHAWLPMPADGVLSIPTLPVPDDQVHAETIEYVALLVGLERALQADDKAYTVVELGASYAPWAIAAGVIGLRERFEAINLVAVEASKDMVPRILEHAERNGLLNNAKIKINACHGAIYTRDENVYFPKVNVAHDNGGQLATEDLKRDYRGLELEHEMVNGYSLGTLLSDYNRVDFLHMDIQGAEAMLLVDDSFLETLDSRVATFFLATQSRFIEGLALQKLSGLGWVLIRERPTMYRQNDRVDVNGWTLRDGGQLWLNPKFGPLYCNDSQA